MQILIRDGEPFIDSYISAVISSIVAIRRWRNRFITRWSDALEAEGKARSIEIDGRTYIGNWADVDSGRTEEQKALLDHMGFDEEAYAQLDAFMSQGGHNSVYLRLRKPLDDSRDLFAQWITQTVSPAIRAYNTRTFTFEGEAFLADALSGQAWNADKFHSTEIIDPFLRAEQTDPAFRYVLMLSRFTWMFEQFGSSTLGYDAGSGTLTLDLLDVDAFCDHIETEGFIDYFYFIAFRSDKDYILGDDDIVNPLRYTIGYFCFNEINDLYGLDVDMQHVDGAYYVAVDALKALRTKEFLRWIELSVTLHATNEAGGFGGTAVGEFIGTLFSSFVKITDLIDSVPIVNQGYWIIYGWMKVLGASEADLKNFEKAYREIRTKVLLFVLTAGLSEAGTAAEVGASAAEVGGGAAATSGVGAGVSATAEVGGSVAASAAAESGIWETVELVLQGVDIAVSGYVGVISGQEATTPTASSESVAPTDAMEASYGGDAIDAFYLSIDPDAQMMWELSEHLEAHDPTRSM